MMPASAGRSLTRNATPGVGITPTSTACPPTDAIPAITAASSISPESRVSRPTTTVGGLPSLLVIIPAPTRPKTKANSGERNALAISRTPSVPNNLVISGSS